MKELHGVLYLVQFHHALIEQVVEDIVVQQGLLPLLLIARDEVNPLVEVG